MSLSLRFRAPSAQKRPGDSLAAPASVGQGACTPPAIGGQSGAGMVHMHIGRNRNAWLQIAAALDSNPHRELSAHARAVAAVGAAPGAAHAGASAGAALGAEPSKLPDGNHGETLNVVQA